MAAEACNYNRIFAAFLAILNSAKFLPSLDIKAEIRGTSSTVVLKPNHKS